MSHKLLSKVGDVAARVLGATESYSASMLKAVAFDASKITVDGEACVNFPWVARRDCLNGFQTVHGGALSTLAEVFTKIHTQAAVPCTPSSMHFEIRFLSAVGEDQEVVCQSRVRSLLTPQRLVFTDFKFISSKTRDVLALGSHVISTEEKRD